MRTVLVIDDNPAVITALDVLFGLREIRTVAASTPEEGLTALDRERVDLVVQDMNFSTDTTSGEEGVALFRAIRDKHPDLPLILLTAWTHLPTAVELVKAGAADYLSKPWDDTKLLATVENLLELGETTREVARLRGERRKHRSELAQKFDLRGAVFASPQMERLIEAELFGAEAGAFTGANKAREGRFELADGGTLLLDEIGNLPLPGQMKLLRILETGQFERLGSSKTRQVKVRVISATNADLVSMIRDGRFREDLYYRLNVIELNLPPLSARPDDILPLAEHFLGDGISLATDAREAMQAYSWPGNVRELKNSIQRASLLCRDGVIRAADLGLVARPSAPAMKPAAPEPDRAMIESALARSKGVISQAAAELGLSRQALYRRLEKLGIQA